MPTKRGVGTSEGTPKKQAALDALAGHLLGSVATIGRRNGTPVVVLDMTSGPGQDQDGNPGSPLILAGHVHALTAAGYPCELICIDRLRMHLNALKGVMRATYPDVSVSYATKQRAVLAELSPRTSGLAYFDPTHYKDLDVDLLRDMGRRFPRLDILFTRECQAGLRMKRAAHTARMRLGIAEYLAATGKRCRYVAQYAQHNWWSFGFADNWSTRPTAKLRWRDGQLVNVDGAQGQRLLAKWEGTKREGRRKQECRQMELPGCA